MRFTHHARNKMRHRRISRTEIRAVLAHPLDTRQDDSGNLILVGVVEGRRIVVVLAADDPELVITVYPKRA